MVLLSTSRDQMDKFGVCTIGAVGFRVIGFGIADLGLSGLRLLSLSLMSSKFVNVNSPLNKIKRQKEKVENLFFFSAYDILKTRTNSAIWPQEMYTLVSRSDIQRNYAGLCNISNNNNH